MKTKNEFPYLFTIITKTNNDTYENYTFETKFDNIPELFTAIKTCCSDYTKNQDSHRFTYRDLYEQIPETFQQQYGFIISFVTDTDITDDDVII